MKNKLKTLSSKTYYIEVTLFLLCTILATCINTSYSLNPFILVLIFLSYQRGIKTYLTTLVFMVITGFILAIPYGVELCIIHAIFFFFSIILCLFKKGYTLKKYGAFFLTHFTIILLFLIRFFSLNNFFNTFLSFIISCALLFGYEKFILCSYEKDAPFDARAKVIVCASFPVLFFGLKGIYIIFVRWIHLLISKSCSAIEGILAILINCLILYYLQDAADALIITILLPGILSCIFNQKYAFGIYLLSYIFISIYALDSFYKSPFFYQGLIGIVLALLTPDQIISFFQQLFMREENQIVLQSNQLIQTSKEKINHILQYLNIVLNTSFNEEQTPLEKTILILEEKVCKECIRNKKCQLLPILKQGLEYNLDKEERVQLFNECLYPYKILRHLRLLKTTYQNEKKYHDEMRLHKEIYQKEFESIYRPLRDVLYHSQRITQQKEYLLEELRKQNYFALDLSISQDEILFKLQLKDKNEIQNVISIISKFIGISYYLEDMFYILSSNVYEIKLSSKPLHQIEHHALSYGLHETYNGDYYSFINENNKQIILLSDGMGHEEKSSTLSQFLIKGLESYRNIEKEENQQIQNINTLLKSKMTEEGYATLDYLIIDLVNGRYRFYKCGSFHSFHYHKGTLTKLKSATPPLGALFHVQLQPLEGEINEGDIFLLMSDGYIEEVEPILNSVLKEFENESTMKLASIINEVLSKDHPQMDDRTLIVLKMQK